MWGQTLAQKRYYRGQTFSQKRTQATIQAILFQQHELKKCISRGGKKIRIHHQQNHNQNQNNDFDIESANELKRSRSK
jgi:hypothetical protein